MAAIYRGWVGDPVTGKGRALRLDGTIVELDEKPPKSEFIPKTRDIEGNLPPEGDYILATTGKFARIGRPGKPTVRTEFFGEVMDRRSANEKAIAEKLNARMQAKGKVDSQNMRMGYDPEQEKQLAGFRSARNKLYKEFQEGAWTPEQVQQLDEQISLRELAVLPQLLKAPPTPQQLFQSAQVTDPVTGMRMYHNGKDWKLVEGQRTAKETAVLIDRAVDALTVDIKNDEGKDIGTRKPTAKEINQWIAGVTLGEAQIAIARGGGGQPDIGADPLAGFRPPGAQPARPAAAPAQPEGLNAIWESGVAALKARYGTRLAPLAAMEQIGNEFVTATVKQGATVDQAIKAFMELWKAQRKKRGILEVGNIPNPRRFKMEKLRQAAELAELELLEAKAGR